MSWPSIYFYRGARNGALDHLLMAPLPEFRSWYYDSFFNEEVLLTEQEAAILPRIDRLIGEGAVALHPFTREEAHLIDDLTHQYYFWCGIQRPDLLSELTRRAFQRKDCPTSNIQENLGDEVALLWQYLLRGRAIGRPDQPFPYTKQHDEGYQAYWTYEEVTVLYECLHPYQRRFSVEPRQAMQTVFEVVEAALDEQIGILIEVG